MLRGKEGGGLEGSRLGRAYKYWWESVPLHATVGIETPLVW